MRGLVFTDRMQNPLTALEHKAVSIALQKSIVPWLIAILGIEFPSNTTADLVRQMVAAIVKRDAIKNCQEGQH